MLFRKLKYLLGASFSYMYFLFFCPKTTKLSFLSFSTLHAIYLHFLMGASISIKKCWLEVVEFIFNSFRPVKTPKNSRKSLSFIILQFIHVSQFYLITLQKDFSPTVLCNSFRAIYIRKHLPMTHNRHDTRTIALTRTRHQCKHSHVRIIIIFVHMYIGKYAKITVFFWQDYGHRVRLATHANFKEFVLTAGLEFYPLGGDPKVLAECKWTRVYRYNFIWSTTFITLI